jgi:hypothetical protein
MGDVLLVAGFHRSGTSLVTQLLHQAGLFVGETLLQPLRSNPYGHFEDSEVVFIHEQILEDNGLDWQVTRRPVLSISPTRWRHIQSLVARRRTTHQLWGFKDPRLCLFLPIWKHVLPEARALLVFRHYADCANSLERRHAEQLMEGFGSETVHRPFFQQPDLALRMWLAQNESLLSFADCYPGDVYAVSFETVRAGYPLVDALVNRWGLALRPTSTLEVFDPTITSDRTYPLPVADPELGSYLEPMLARLRALESASREQD